MATAFTHGAVTAREMVETAFARIAADDGAINAFTDLLSERARERARDLDRRLARGEALGPLAGVPFAVKNLYDIAGLVTRAGALVTRDDAAAVRDADAVAALESAGAICIGTTNMDEFAYGFVTENAHDGPTRNPHDRTRSAGGSSGGSAAAVAAGFVSLALGSDTNGSVRVPAALCGIYGLKPTYGRLSRRGVYPFVDSLDHVGCFAANAEDLAASWYALSGEVAAAHDTDAPRIARATGYFEEDAWIEAIEAVDMIASALGVTERVEIPQAQRAREAAFVITAAEGGALHAERLRTRYDDYDPATRDRLIAGALVPSEWVVRAQRFRRWFARSAEALFERYDIIIAPATPHPAMEIGADPSVRVHLGKYTQPISFIGYPVVVVPVLRDGELPLGVQLIAAPHREALLLQVAAQLGPMR